MGPDNSPNNYILSNAREFNTHKEIPPFLEELKKVDAQMDELYAKELEEVEPESVRFGFDDIADGDGSADFRIRRMAEVMAKYQEYTSRLWVDPRYTSPESLNGISSWYKREAARRVIVDGYVNTWALGRAVAKKFGRNDVERYDEACAVIHTYVVNGGKEAEGGTGFPNFTTREP